MNQPSIQLVALDLSGTTVERDGTIHDATKAAVRACAERGVHFALATGNTPASARSFAEELGVGPYIIACSGAAVTAPDGTPLSSSPFPRDALPPLLAACAGLPVRIGVVIGEQYYVDQPPSLSSRSQAQYAPDLLAVIAEDPTMVMVLGGDETIAALWQKLDGVHPEVRLTSPGDRVLQVVQREVSKGKTLLGLGETLGISPDRIMAIGDAANDLEMVRDAGLGVAVANATDAVKRAARHITAAPAGQGVVEALQRFILDAPPSR